jgi:hypothetical protein
MHASRHPFAVEPIVISAPAASHIVTAGQLEQIGNWHLAGETYGKLAQETAGITDTETRAKVLARAATCFELAGQAQPAALAYSDAARLLSQKHLRPQTAAELFNRAAILYRSNGVYHFAGFYWLDAAREFDKVSSAIINSPDGLPPVPMAGFKWAVVGACYNAAGDAFIRADDYEMHACGAYWEAGKAQSQPNDLPNIQSFNAYRKALKACVQYYKTLELNELRRFLPLTAEERTAQLNPLETMEKAAFRCNYHHQSSTDDAARQSQATIETDRLMVAAFHEFSVALNAIGNSREAGVFRAKEQELRRRIFRREKRYGAAVLYFLWNMSSNYGESLRRWVMTCSIFITGFALIFHFGNLIKPDEGWFNCFYFSWLTFTGFGYSDTYFPSEVLGKVMSGIEIGIGLFMFGVLLSFLGNRVQRA